VFFYRVSVGRSLTANVEALAFVEATKAHQPNIKKINRITNVQLMFVSLYNANSMLA
jgi:type III secretory pathway component EscU